MQPTPQQLSLASSIYTNRILLIQQWHILNLFQT
jgi:hypothetical protein